MDKNPFQRDPAELLLALVRAVKLEKIFFAYPESVFDLEVYGDVLESLGTSDA